MIYHKNMEKNGVIVFHAFNEDKRQKKPPHHVGEDRDGDLKLSLST